MTYEVPEDRACSTNLELWLGSDTAAYRARQRRLYSSMLTPWTDAIGTQGGAIRDTLPSLPMLRTTAWLLRGNSGNRYRLMQVVILHDSKRLVDSVLRKLRHHYKHLAATIGEHKGRSIVSALPVTCIMMSCPPVCARKCLNGQYEYYAAACTATPGRESNCTATLGSPRLLLSIAG